MSQEVWFNKKTQEHVKYLGRKNKLEECNRRFVEICKMSPAQLKNYLSLFLFEQGYDFIHTGDGYIYAKGKLPICLTAHMDTVHTELVKTTYEYNSHGDYLISSPQGIGGDDRCGVYMIINLIEKGYKPYIVFCEEEEVGCVGSKKFIKTDYIDEIGQDCNYIIELDRANGNDSVYYNCANDEFEKFINTTTGYKTSWGTCSDISTLCPASKIAGVNLSCGYYNAHTLGEYVNMTEMKHTQDVVEVLLNTESVKYEYKEKEYKYDYYDEYYSGWGSYYNSMYSRNCYGGYHTSSKPKQIDYVQLEITWTDKETKEEHYDYEVAETEEACWTEFFFNNPSVCFNDILDWDYVA